MGYFDRLNQFACLIDLFPKSPGLGNMVLMLIQLIQLFTKSLNLSLGSLT